MNRKPTKEFVEKNRIVTLKADKTNDSPEIDQLLVELGNEARAIPFYAIFPGQGGDPIILQNLISLKKLIRALEQAGPSLETGEEVAQRVDQYFRES